MEESGDSALRENETGVTEANNIAVRATRFRVIIFFYCMFSLYYCRTFSLIWLLLLLLHISLMSLESTIYKREQ